MFFLRFFYFQGNFVYFFFSVLHMNKNSDFVLEIFINLLVKNNILSLFPHITSIISIVNVSPYQFIISILI